jgi:hypothetical protein
MAPHEPVKPEDMIEDFLKLEEHVKELGKQIEELRKIKCPLSYCR